VVDGPRKVSRRLAATLVVGAAVLTLGALAIIGCGTSTKKAAPHTNVIALDRLAPRKGRAPTHPPTATKPRTAGVSLSRLVGRKLVVRMTGQAPDAQLLDRVRQGLVGGVILFQDNVGSPVQLRATIDQLQSAARAGGEPGLIVAIDQEGGMVKRLPAGPPNRSPRELGASGSTAAARSEGRQTGAYLRSLGINVDLAPVLDVPQSSAAFIAPRAFGSSAGSVARLGSAFATGLEDRGVAATAKHFPGLGWATTNTDAGSSVVGASPAALATQLLPFRRAISGGIGLVMLSNATYPAYDPQTPAGLSRQIVDRLLRGRLGFQGVTITDDLQAPAVTRFLPLAQAAVAGTRAGDDLLLLARDPGAYQSVFDGLMADARSHRLNMSQLRESYDRVNRLLSGSG